MEKKEKNLELAIEIPEVNALLNTLQENAIIFRFNGYWPKFEELNAWIYQNGTKDCDIYLFAKGFFVV